ncbi:ABC transporter permease [Paenibacillus nuruki]|uniref:ABC transporter permease n=1 Tax=Paenibacillus nuruki TaxID=1886670 RepID=UPI0028046CE1|nr:ABC transporter permease [Paenibacillus nuruki]CAJ1314985.1 Dipeptide transport system permease protein DppC [Paenibacillus nuruki]
MKQATPTLTTDWQNESSSTVRSKKLSWQATTTRYMWYIALALIAFIVLCALVPQWIAPYSPVDMVADRILQAPNAINWLGTDYFGRDIFSLVVYGARDSLLIGFSSVVIGVLVGVLLGTVAGYIGGILDTIVMRFIDILMTIPGVLLALAIAAALGPGLLNIIIAISVSAIPGYARVMRGQMVSLRSRGYVEASRSLGASGLRIVWKHILPNAVSPILVMGTLGLGTAILTGAGLSFLGLGVIHEIPDWGALLSQGRGYLTVAWWICTFPGLAITVFVLAINIIGDDLRDRLDPQSSYL